MFERMTLSDASNSSLTSSVTASSLTSSTLTLTPINSTALCSMLVTARREGRLVCGVYMCGKALDHDLDDVMLCVLPETSPDDVTNHMHSILIEAFCVENDVRVVKVDCAAKLRLLFRSADACDVSHATPPSAAVDQSESSSDLHCLLVMYPPEEDQLSQDEEAVLHFHSITVDILPQPVIDLDPVYPSDDLDPL